MKPSTILYSALLALPLAAAMQSASAGIHPSGGKQYTDAQIENAIDRAFNVGVKKQLEDLIALKRCHDQRGDSKSCTSDNISRECRRYASTTVNRLSMFRKKSGQKTNEKRTKQEAILDDIILDAMSTLKKDLREAAKLSDDGGPNVEDGDGDADVDADVDVDVDVDADVDDQETTPSPVPAVQKCFDACVVLKQTQCQFLKAITRDKCEEQVIKAECRSNCKAGNGLGREP